MEIKGEYLEDDWLKEMDKTNKLYQDFYLDDVYYTNLHFIYVNKSNEIEKIKEEMFLMKTPNQITREEMIFLLKKNMIENDIGYNLHYILKCNVSLQPDEIKVFIQNPNYLNEYNDKFITCIKNFDSLHFDRTINMFQDLNDLFIVYIEKSNTNMNNTDNKINKHNITKKVVFLKNNKKTHRRY